ncbi:hypothetical protein ElyMa_002607600 [Elysia marginata]|uniref:Uncharacterized protein n=1 Tax=Elysia marginata TaxID=1093978 RepID=A0AAV4H297_9GAST|nr:hypothetical protein ElyMa_002607600 [Elysia marginata]
MCKVKHYTGGKDAKARGKPNTIAWMNSLFRLKQTDRPIQQVQSAELRAEVNLIESQHAAMMSWSLTEALDLNKKSIKKKNLEQENCQKNSFKDGSLLQWA